MKLCPFCAEEIQDNAIKCKHCGEWLKKDAQLTLQGSDTKSSKLSEPQHQSGANRSEPYEKIKTETEVGITKPEPSAEPKSTENIKSREVNNAIMGAWIAGIISGTITLICASVGYLGYGLYNLIDVLLAYGLSYGIYKKSRICAILLLLYFFITKIITITKGDITPLTIFVALTFVFFFAYGVYGTFLYHKLNSSN